MGDDRRKSLKRYASRFFTQEQTFDAVQHKKPRQPVSRKVFRVVVFLLFAAAFLYQCIKFFSYVLGYPTVVNIEIIRPEKYLAPAFTFCNYNDIKRSTFCRLYPDLCVDAHEGLCEKYRSYCGENATKVPYDDAVEELELDVNDFLELGHGRDMVEKATDFFESGADEIIGPLPRYRQYRKRYSSCLTIHSRVESPLDALYIKRRKNLRLPSNLYKLDPQVHEQFYPTYKPGIVFAVHSQFDAVNPFKKGMFMKPGYLYRLSISMKEGILLPYPYKTDCMNYTDLWIKNNRTGPRSKEMCREKCIVEVSKYCWGCVIPRCLYPSQERFCTDEDFELESTNCGSQENISFVVGGLMKSCIEHCKDDCSKMKYIYEVQELYLTPKWKNNSDMESSQNIIVEIKIEDSEIITHLYKPQFQDVEIFSYIGGFIGIWLGVSLVQVADAFEAAFRCMRRICSKKKAPESVGSYK